MSINSDYSFTEQLIHVSRLISAIRAYEIDAGHDSTGATEFLHDYAESLCVIIEQEQRKTPATYEPSAEELATLLPTARNLTRMSGKGEDLIHTADLIAKARQASDFQPADSDEAQAA